MRWYLLIIELKNASWNIEIIESATQSDIPVCTKSSVLNFIFNRILPFLYTSYAKLVATFYRISKNKIKKFIVHLEIVSPAGPPLPTENVGIFEDVYKI